MTKKELRAQLLNDTLTFVLQGGQIQEVPAQKTRIKVTCRGRTSNGFMSSSEPSFNISSIYNREV